MNSKWHFYISNLKSIIRIISCILAIMFMSLNILAIGFIIAEILGVLEEIGDKR